MMLLEVTEDRQCFGDLTDGAQFPIAHDAISRGDDDHDVDQGRVMIDGFHGQDPTLRVEALRGKQGWSKARRSGWSAA